MKCELIEVWDDRQIEFELTSLICDRNKMVYPNELQGGINNLPGAVNDLMLVVPNIHAPPRFHCTLPNQAVHTHHFKADTPIRNLALIGIYRRENKYCRRLPAMEPPYQFFINAIQRQGNGPNGKFHVKTACINPALPHTALK